jgi:hypothetical protein
MSANNDNDSQHPAAVPQAGGEQIPANPNVADAAAAAGAAHTVQPQPPPKAAVKEGNAVSVQSVLITILTSFIVSATVAILAHVLTQWRDKSKVRNDNTFRLLSHYNSPEMQEARLKVWVKRKELLVGKSLAEVYDSMGTQQPLCADEELFIQLLVITSFFREMNELLQAGQVDGPMLARHFRNIFDRWQTTIYEPGFKDLPPDHWLQEVKASFDQLQRDLTADER